MWKVNLFDPPPQNKNVRTKSLPIDLKTSPVSTRSSSLRQGGEKRPDLKNIVRADNLNNPGNLLYICPEFGNKFQYEAAQLKRLDYSVEHDIREFFLSDVERKVMLATLRFSTNYVLGFIDSKDMRLIGADAEKFKFKTKENIIETSCTVCNYKFNKNTRLWHLSIWVHRNKSPKDPKKFDFCCKDCSITVKDYLNIHEIYPRLNFVDFHELNKEGFFSTYIFPIDVGYYNLEQTKRIEITDHHGDVFKIVQHILMDHKNENEHFISITLANMSGNIMVEEYKRIDLHRYRYMTQKPKTVDEVDCFIVADDSEMMDAVKNKMFYSIKGTVFATIKFRTHKSSYKGVITFPVRPVLTGYCNLCKKSKMYYKNPILYCTKCGFTSRYQFVKESKNFANLPFVDDFVTSHEMYNEMILYYNMKDLHEYIKTQKK